MNTATRTAAAAQAAAIDVAPAIDFAPEFAPVEEKKEDPLAKFTPDEQRQIRAVADKIDITDSNAVLGYGASAQRKVSDFADGALQSVRSKVSVNTESRAEATVRRMTRTPFLLKQRIC